jgi:sulfur relay (sulfurtransferase) complex TusBCD TusD component (DsrE family)
MALKEMSNRTPEPHDCRKSLFLGVMGAPYESELSTTVLRMVDVALRQDHRVTVWTCGGATTLTLQSLTDSKPENLLDFLTGRRDASYRSTAALVAGLLGMSEGRLRWLVCRHCMTERGAHEQMPGVKITSAFNFLRYLNEADISMVMGVK